MAQVTDAPPVAPTPRPSRKERRRHKRELREATSNAGAWFPRWYWPSFAAPASIWLLFFFLVPFYVIVAVAFGTKDPIFQTPVPIWQPWWWDLTNVRPVFANIANFEMPVFYRTFAYVIISSILCIIIGYGVAYYVARFGGKRKGLYLALLVAPFFISYLMRMLAWINLLQSDGYVTRILNWLPFVPHNVDWLGGRPITLILGLVYGYIPYMILPLYGFLDSIGGSLLEAGRDLGAGPVQTFLRVTLPLSQPAILAGIVIVSLPMFGDYYTHNLLSPSPNTSMIGNLLYDAVESSGQQGQAAVYVIILMVILLIPMWYYLRTTKRSMEAR
jgi:ABC-type spermidine/putrescine transport system permease subunit I